MAEGILDHLLTTSNRTDYIVNSAGLHALVGRNPDPYACQLLSEKGIDISDHKACQVDLSMIRNAQLILVMEQKQKRIIENYDSSARGKVYRLGEWGRFDIIDPYQQEIGVFAKSLQLIETGLSQWLKKL